MEELINIIKSSQESPETMYAAVSQICQVITTPLTTEDKKQGNESILPMVALAGAAFLAGKQTNVA